MEIKTHPAIQDVCAWPNLQQLQDGTLLATIFNQPCHGKWEGDLDCWASEDGGETWKFQGRPAAHEPGTNRMNCAVGFAKNGDLLVLCSGWNERLPAGQPTDFREGVFTLTPWICRSSDAGKTWSVSTDFPDQPHGKPYIPFGDIIAGDDGDLRAFVYGRSKCDSTGATFHSTFVLRSSDDGKTWGNPVVLNGLGNETMGIHLGNGKWLAASREQKSQSVYLFTSDDDAKTWWRKFPLTLPKQLNGHLLELEDSRIVLSFGNRCQNNYGVDVRISEDKGETWGSPIRIGDTDFSDCGYPSTIQRNDGSCVTAWYTRISEESHYEMRVTTWKL